MISYVKSTACDATTSGAATGTNSENAGNTLIQQGSAVSHIEPTRVTKALPAPAVPDLTVKQDAFARHYVEFGSVADAYRSAYDVAPTTTSQTARTNGHRVLNHPKVQARVRALRAELAATSLMSTNELIADLESMATADVNELMCVTVVGCRWCWGEGHGYQWRNEAELQAAVEHHIASLATPKPEPMPDARGLFGYRPDRDPNPECPRCDGVGVNVVRLTNTADVSPGARKLYRGVELYPDGTVKKILLNDPLAARMELHRVRGMHVDRSINLNANVTVPPLASMSQADVLDFLESIRPTQ